MKRGLILLSLVMVIGFSGLAQASLFTWEKQGDKVVYDSTEDLYWVWDLAATTDYTYAEQIIYSDKFLNTGSGYFGLYDWHMADLSEIEKLWTYDKAQVAAKFNHTLDGSPTWWIGRYDEEDPGVPGAHLEARIMYIGGTYSYDHTLVSEPDGTGQSYLGAWYVTGSNTQYTHTPVPTSVLLLASGLAGLAGWRKKRRRLG